MVLENTNSSPHPLFKMDFFLNRPLVTQKSTPFLYFDNLFLDLIS